jgi:hypothetical protein
MFSIFNLYGTWQYTYTARWDVGSYHCLRVADCNFVKGSRHETVIVKGALAHDGRREAVLGGVGGGGRSTRFCVNGLRLRAAQGTKA